MGHSTLMRLALFVSLCTGLSYAQSQNPLPDAPQAQPVVHAMVTPTLQSQPSRQAGTSERSFVLWSALSFGATIADVESTRHAITACGLRETNPFFGSNPSRTRMYAQVLPITTAQTLLGWYIHKRKPDSRLWMLLPAANTAVHTAGFANNFARCH